MGIYSTLSKYQYKPFKYFFLTLFTTWVSLFSVAYFVNKEVVGGFQLFLGLIGLFSPFIIALILIYGSEDKSLIKDFKKRIFNFKLIKTKYLIFILFIMPVVLILATSISLLLGQPATQFYLSDELTGSVMNVLLTLVALALAPTFEELGWRGYGVDSIKQGRNIFKTTLIFALLWDLWHVPLFFINGYYQNELINQNIFYALNFIVSIFPAAFLMNWIYFKNNRSISAIILFHIMLNLFSMILQTEQVTKMIVTSILILTSTYIYIKDKNFFMSAKNI